MQQKKSCFFFSSFLSCIFNWPIHRKRKRNSATEWKSFLFLILSLSASLSPCFSVVAKCNCASAKKGKLEIESYSLHPPAKRSVLGLHYVVQENKTIVWDFSSYYFFLWFLPVPISFLFNIFPFTFSAWLYLDWHCDISNNIDAGGCQLDTTQTRGLCLPYAFTQEIHWLRTIERDLWKYIRTKACLERRHVRRCLYSACWLIFSPWHFTRVLMMYTHIDPFMMDQRTYDPF